MARKILLNAIKFAVFLSIGLFLLWLITKDYTEQDWADFKYSLLHANYWWVAFAVCVGILSHLIRALRWNMMISPLGYHPRLKTTFYSVMIAYLTNMAVPRLGEITRCGILQRYEKVPFEKTLGTIVVERGIDLISLFIVTLLLLLLQFNIIYDFFNDMILSPLSDKIRDSENFLLISLAVLVGIVILSIIVIRKFRHTELYLRIRILLMNVREGIYSIRHLKNFPLFLFYTVFMWFCYFSMVWLCFYSIPQTSHFGVAEALAVMVFGTFGIILTPGGIGAYHAFVSKALFVLYGLEETYGNSFSWIAWGSQTAMIIIIGVASLLILSRQRTPNAENQETGSDTGKNQ